MSFFTLWWVVRTLAECLVMYPGFNLTYDRRAALDWIKRPASTRRRWVAQTLRDQPERGFE